MTPHAYHFLLQLIRHARGMLTASEKYLQSVEVTEVRTLTATGKTPQQAEKE